MNKEEFVKEFVEETKQKKKIMQKYDEVAEKMMDKDGKIVLTKEEFLDFIIKTVGECTYEVGMHFNKE